MPRQTLIWEEGRSSQLELSWGWQWRDFTLNLDGQRIGTIVNENALRQGQTFSLTNGSSLKVQLVNRFLFPVLVVSKNGHPLQEVPAERNLRQLGMIYVSILLLIAGGAKVIQPFFAAIRQRIALARESSPQTTQGVELLEPGEQRELSTLSAEALQTLSPEERLRFQALLQKGEAASNEEIAELHGLRQKGILALPQDKQIRLKSLIAKALILAAQKQASNITVETDKEE